VEANGGAVTVQSSIGKGSQFTVTIRYEKFLCSVAAFLIFAGPLRAEGKSAPSANWFRTPRQAMVLIQGNITKVISFDQFILEDFD